MGRPNNDAAHLARLRDYYARHQTLPSYAQISKLLRFKAKNAALMLARRLAENRFLQPGPGGRLVPGARFFERACLDDSVPAGTGEPGEWSGGIGHHAIDRLLVDTPSKTLLVPVRGDSMSGAGVLDGDLAVVEKSEHANHGDFVIALVDGRQTFKELRMKQRKAMLVPHNERYSPITPHGELSIVGVVRGIIRRYEPATGRTSLRKQGGNT